MARSSRARACHSRSPYTLLHDPKYAGACVISFVVPRTQKDRAWHRASCRWPSDKRSDPPRSATISPRTSRKRLASRLRPSMPSRTAEPLLIRLRADAGIWATVALEADDFKEFSSTVCTSKDRPGGTWGYPNVTPVGRHGIEALETLCNTSTVSGRALVILTIAVGLAQHIVRGKPSTRWAVLAGEKKTEKLEPGEHVWAGLSYGSKWP
jgi:hypothetical protein